MSIAMQGAQAPHVSLSVLLLSSEAARARLPLYILFVSLDPYAVGDDV